ncbi:hypothetical protein GCM10018955_25940 [Planomonospora venezuelensis]
MVALRGWLFRPVRRSGSLVGGGGGLPGARGCAFDTGRNNHPLRAPGAALSGVRAVGAVVLVSAGFAPMLKRSVAGPVRGGPPSPCGHSGGKELRAGRRRVAPPQGACGGRCLRSPSPAEVFLKPG